jgi:cytochrome c oxidase subunit 2
MTAWLDTIQSAAGNDGQQSALVSGLFSVFLVVTATFYLAVIVFLLGAVVRRRREGESRERGLRKMLVGWVGLISLSLAGLTVVTWLYDRGLAEAAATPALEIEVTANQWWWDVRYADKEADEIFRTANELHLPAGIPAHITLRSNDVIHSFWIPNLAGR